MLVEDLEVLVTLSCLTLGDPKTVACQAPQSLGILQARLLEWVAVPYSSGYFWTLFCSIDLYVCFYVSTILF